MKKNYKPMRVDPEFHKWATQLAEEYDTSARQITKKMADNKDFFKVF